MTVPPLYHAVCLLVAGAPIWPGHVGPPLVVVVVVKRKPKRKEMWPVARDTKANGNNLVASARSDRNERHVKERQDRQQADRAGGTVPS